MSISDNLDRFQTVTRSVPIPLQVGEPISRDIIVSRTRRTSLQILRRRILGMHILSFTLSAEAVVRIHDVVLCLSRFSEIVSLEANIDRVGLRPSFRSS